MVTMGKFLKFLQIDNILNFMYEDYQKEYDKKGDRQVNGSQSG